MRARSRAATRRCRSSPSLYVQVETRPAPLIPPPLLAALLSQLIRPSCNPARCVSATVVVLETLDSALQKQDSSPPGDQVQSASRGLSSACFSVASCLLSLVSLHQRRLKTGRRSRAATKKETRAAGGRGAPWTPSRTWTLTVRATSQSARLLLSFFSQQIGDVLVSV